MTFLWKEDAKRFREPFPYAVFWTFWKKKKKKVSKRFQNEEWSIQLTQCFFLRNLVLWVNMFIEEDSMPLVDFIDWV